MPEACAEYHYDRFLPIIDLFGAILRSPLFTISL